MSKKDKKIAKERINILLEESKKALKEGDKELSRNYVKKAKRIGTKYQIPLGKMKRLFCNECNIYFIPGKTLRVRTKKKDMRTVFTCLECGHVQRYRYVKEKKKL